MKTSKRFLAVLLAVIMVLSCFPITALAASKAPAKPKSITSTSTDTTVTVKWGKVKNAKGYDVYKYDSKKKKYSKVGTTTKTSYTVKKLKACTTYVYAVKSYNTVKKKKYYSAYSAKHTTSTSPAKVKSVSYSGVTTDSFTVTWSAVKGANAYKVQYTTDPSFATGVASITTTAKSQKLSALTPGTVYYVKVCSVRNANKKAYPSAPTAAISVTTVALPAPAQPSNPAPAQPQLPPDEFSATRSVVNESVSYQTITGFGASNCWWAQKIGGWDNADDYLKLLYDKNEGIGLNIYRYNLGAGSIGDSELIRGKQTETFLATGNDPESIDASSFDWSRDANAQKTLALAKKYSEGSGNNLRLCIFANSPPVQLTTNHKAYCDFNEKYETVTSKNSQGVDQTWNRPVEVGWINFYDLHENLSKFQYKNYINYIINIADHFEAEGYDVADVAPMNEPQFDWSEYKVYKMKNWKYVDENGNYIAENLENEEIDEIPDLAQKRVFDRFEMTQEGCHYYPESVATLFDRFATQTKDKPYTMSFFESADADVGVNPSHENSWCKYFGTFAPYFKVIMNNKNVYNTYNNVSLHSYWMDKGLKKNTLEYMNSKKPGMTVSCTEYCQMPNDVNTGVQHILKPLEWWWKDSRGPGIEFGVQMARVINEDMTNLNATEWNWWTAVSGGTAADALLYYDIDNEDVEFDSSAKPVVTTKRFWCLGNYSRYIQCGAKRVQVSEAQGDLISTAYKNPDGSLVIVYVNQFYKDYTVNVNANGYSSYNAYVTSASQNLENTQTGAYSYATGISIPAQSVVTVVLK